MTCCCPIAAGDGHDFPRLVEERVPGVAAVVDDVVEGFEDAVGQPVGPHELPDVFLRIELRRARRQRQERDVAWRLEAFGAMPSGLIENENGVGAGSDFRCDLVEMKLYRLGIAKREHESSSGSEVETDCTEHVGGLRALIMDRRGT